MYSPEEVLGKKVWAHWVWCKYAIDFLKQDGEWKFWKFRCYELARAPFEENWVSFGLKNQGAFDLDLMYFGDDGKPVFMPPADEPVPSTRITPTAPRPCRSSSPCRRWRTTPSPTPSPRRRIMATHNSLFSEKDVRRTDDGLAVSVQLPWYRSLWLSAVDGVAATVNGVAVPQGRLRFALERPRVPRRGTARAVRDAVVRRRPARRADPARRRARGGRDDHRRGRADDAPALHADHARRRRRPRPLRHQPRAGRAGARAGMTSRHGSPAHGALRVAMIGYGFMGAAHSVGGGRRRACSTCPRRWRWPSSSDATPRPWPRPPRSGAGPESATDWREVIARDDIDIVDIVTPGRLARRDRDRGARGRQARAVREAAREHGGRGRGDGGCRGPRRRARRAVDGGVHLPPRPRRDASCAT